MDTSKNNNHNVGTTSKGTAATTTNEISPLFKGGPFIRYAMDPIDHPKYGKATFCRDIPLLVPFRGHTREEIIPELQECYRIAEELIEVGRNVWADDDDETVLFKLREFAFTCAIMAGMKPSNPRFILFVYAMVVFIHVDDQFDSVSSLDEIFGPYKEFNKTHRETDEVFERDIPSATVEAARMLKSWDGLKVRLLEIPDYFEKYKVALRQEIYVFAASHLALAELKKQGLSFSDFSSREILRNIAAPAIVTEYVAILRDANIPDYVRNDVLFAVARNKVSDVEIEANAILGLHRDLQKEQFDSPIMEAIAKGVPIQEAIDKTYADLLDALHDLKLATDKLLETYEGDETVRRYVHIMVGGMDGMFYAYKFCERYRITDKLTLFEK